MEQLNQTSNSQQKKKKKSNPVGLIVLIVCILLVVGFASIALFSDEAPQTESHIKIEKNFQTNKIAKTFNFGNFTENKTPAPTGDYIAKIFITGVIEEENKTYNQEWLIDTINTLKEDKNNKGIILLVDSPGGSVYESDEAYLALSNYQTSRKPVWAYMTHLAASGAYYISCGTEYICANRNTLTGSIGVIAGQSIDMTGLMEKVGIKSKTFTAGKNKNMLNYNNPLTEEQANIMQSIADECYDQFTSIVAINRKIDITKVKEIADGRIYTAAQAQKLKLIDKVCTFNEAVSALKAKYQLTDCEVIDYVYQPKTTWYDIFNSALSNFKPLTQSTESKVLEMISPKIKYPAYIYSNN